VRILSGTRATGLDALEWARTLVERGAGELLVTSMDSDGTKGGYDTSLLRRLTEVVTVPIVASGGAGNMQHVLEALTVGKADAVLAASIFHFNEILIPELKQYLNSHGVAIRL
jgi:cyclase